MGPPATRTLPQLLYLLSYDTAKERPEVSSILVRGPLLRAAAVAALTIEGRLRPAVGRPGRVERTPRPLSPPGDPFLAEVFAAVPAERTRRRVSVIDEDWHGAEEAVLAGLVADGTISVERHRRWGLVPVRRTTARWPEEVRALRERVRAPVLDGSDPVAIPIEDAVLATLAADGNVAIVFGLLEQHRHRGALEVLADQVEARLPGLREGALSSVAARRGVAA